ncbi:type II secretion system protein M [candidate division NPL-UPA2 bacterium]|nr:type II secretion system protein M [candidate division NPL-UPA2 bacterium]
MLTKRERIALIGGGAFLFILLFYQLGISPVTRRIEILEEKIHKREEDLKGITKLRSEYLTLKENLKSVEQGLAARGKDFNLFSFLEKLTVECGIKEKLFSMKPRKRPVSDCYKQSVVEIKLKGIDISELTAYLYRIENPNRFLTINNLRLRPQRASPGKVEVSLTVSTLIFVDRK